MDKKFKVKTTETHCLGYMILSKKELKEFQSQQDDTQATDASLYTTNFYNPYIDIIDEIANGKYLVMRHFY